MAILAWLGLAALGFVAGYFLSFSVLVAITIVAVLVFLYMAATNREMATLVTMAYGVCAGGVLLFMWVTYYFSTEQNWLQEFIHQHILR